MKKLLLVLFLAAPALARGPSDPLPTGFSFGPSTAVWNTSIENAVVHSSNSVWMDSINGHTLHNAHMDFGINFASKLNGIPYNIVYATDTARTVLLGSYADESDTQPVAGIPAPLNVIIESDPGPVGDPYVDNFGDDCHMLNINVSTPTQSILYETFFTTRTAGNGLRASQFSLFYSSSNRMRTDGWTSADAAGMPLFPLLIRYDEVKAGVINHALRFTISLVRGHLWPASHDANTGGTLNPPLGMRVRMKSSYDCSGFSTDMQVICTALKKYGMFMNDTGGDWFITGAPNPLWDFTTLHDEFASMIPFNVFEVVEQDTWMVSPTSYEAVSPVAPSTNMTGSVQIQ